MILPKTPYQALTGSAEFPISGDGGKSIEFGAAGDGARRTNAAGVFLLGAAFTLEAFIKPTSFSALQTIMARWFFPGNLQILFTVDNTGHLNLRYTTNGSSQVVRSTVDPVVTTGIYQHVAAAYDGTDVQFFVNGILEETVGTAGAVVFPGATSDWLLGADSNLSVFWTDVIFRSRVWSTKRTPTEILDNYQLRIETDPDLHASWPDGLIDTHSTNDLTLVGNAVLSNDTP